MKIPPPIMWIAGVIGVLSVVYGLLRFTNPGVPDHPYFFEDDVMVIAHRGGVNLWPENTIYGFERALALGVDVLEMDVRSTADGRLVVLHDETVDRTTNGRGRVSELSLAELLALDAGYTWPDRIVTREREIAGDQWQRPFGSAAPPSGSDPDHPYRGLGIRVPLLTQVLERFPNARMNIDLKETDEESLTRFIEIMQEADRAERTLLASFHPSNVDAFRERLPEYPTSGVERGIRPFVILDKIFLAELVRVRANAFQVPEYVGSLRVITPSFTRSANRLNLRVDAWSAGSWDGPIVTKPDMQRLLDAGVDGIITDRPDLLLELLGRR
jgi:glycerophosphoryl diester phosphodiesterase